MYITLQELLEIASTNFQGVPYTKLWVFYSEESGQFFLLECQEAALPTHNNLDLIIDLSRRICPGIRDSEICISWQEPKILARN